MKRKFGDDEGRSTKNVKTFAVCFGYLGTGFHGSQRQAGRADLPTLEGELERALIETGLMDERDTGKWTRAARTDKGVHAVGNLVSVSLSGEFPIDKINEILETKNIKVFFAHKVVGRFDARVQCDKRRYEYLVPKSVIPEAETETENFLEKVRAAFAEYKGTKNFHNFTSGIVATDPQAMRYIISTEVVDVDDSFFKVVLVGQSFLLNQIRKMVACALEFALNRTTLEDIRGFLTTTRTILRMAPAEGLLLDRLFYDMYDEHKCNFKDILPIGWALKEADDRIDLFKREIVYPEIMKSLPNRMSDWIQSLDQTPDYQVESTDPSGHAVDQSAL